MGQLTIHDRGLTKTIDLSYDWDVPAFVDNFGISQALILV